MSAEVVSWGIIGCAGIAEKTCQAIADAKNATVVAVGSRNVDKAANFVKRHAPGAAPYASYDDVLKDSRVQAVYIPLPTAMRKEWVLKAAANKKHVLCEKPIAVSNEDAEEMIKACKEAGVQFMDNTMMMHHDRLKKIQEIVGNHDAFGAVKHVVSCFTIPFGNEEEWARNNIRMNGSTEPYGALGDLGWYSIRISQWAFRYEEPQEVSCHYFESTEDAVPITAHAILKYSGGRTATFDCSFKCSLRQWVEVVGEKHRVSWDDFVVTHEKDEARYTVAEAGIAEKAITFPKRVLEEGNVQKCVQHVKLIENMSELVSKGVIDHWPTISEQTQRIMMALHESAKNNGTWTKAHAPSRVGQVPSGHKTIPMNCELGYA
eukprot:TRINITY_DN5792_c0_g2_i1.p2 TRINITY_DN5792_c0_g2~~TRINITY_DN5792_c0_g2_i1.p2  ORF type:complete len:400 (+),score=70.63 TRINITY_DN5792_c0_g2_i1:73-1200(+)